VTLLYLVIFVAIFTALILFVYVYGTRLANSAITDQFQAAEAITQHRFPKKWQRQIALRLRLRQGFGSLGRSELDAIAKRLALKKLKTLITFFQKSRFFDSEETREVLLADLERTLTLWQEKSWQEIRVMQSSQSVDVSG
jgi:hypothetical protein